MKTISVVIPVYNTKKYLNKCLDSVLKQTYTALEVLIVDDGSTDGSGALCDELAKKDTRVNVIHKPNGGVSDTRNAGVEAAMGEFLCFIDSDDWIEADALKDSCAALGTSGAEIAIWGYRADFVDEHEEIQSSRCVCPDEKWNQDLPIDQYGISECLGLCGYVWNKLYSMKLVRANSLQFKKAISLFEDIMFNAEAITKASRAVYIPYAYTHYMQRNIESLGTKYYPNFTELKLLALDAHIALLRHWHASSGFLEEYIAIANLGLVWSIIKGISFSSAPQTEKRIKCNEVLRDRRIMSAVVQVKPQNRNQRIQKMLIQLRNVPLLLRATKR